MYFINLNLNDSNSINVAFSLRKIISTYNGNAICVRRSPDNTEMNIDFNADGTLNTTSLLNFANGSNVYVKIWYDQSGNNNLIQNNSTQQPRIVNNGNIDMQNNKPQIRFFASDVLKLNIEITNNPFIQVINNFGTESSYGFLLGHTVYYYYHSNPPTNLFSSQYTPESIKNSNVWQNGSNITPLNAVYNQKLMINSIQPNQSNIDTKWDNIGQDRTFRDSANGGYSEIIIFNSRLTLDKFYKLTIMQGSYYSIKINLTNANLTGLDLTGANLTGANLTGANLTGAILTNTIYLLINTNIILNSSKTMFTYGDTTTLSLPTLSNVTYQLYQSTTNTFNGTLVPNITSSPYTTPNTLSTGQYYYYYKITNISTNSFVYTNIITITITKALLTVKANNSSKLYNTQDPTFTYIVSGFVNGESESSLESGDYTKPTVTRTNSVVNNANIYTDVLFPNNGTATNYNFNYESDNFEIIGAEKLLIYNTDYFIYGDDIYPTQLSGQYIDASNTLASITFNRNNDGSYYGKDPTNNDIILTLNLNFNNTNLSSANKLKVGSYAISPSIAIYKDSVIVPNYANFKSYILAYSQIEIKKKNSILSITSAISKVYDGTNTCNINNSDILVNDKITGDTVTVINNSSYNTVNVDTNIIINVIFSLDGADASNYSLTQPTNINGSITGKQLSYSGSKIYDKTNIVNVLTISGYINSETLIYNNVTCNTNNVGLTFINGINLTDSTGKITNYLIPELTPNPNNSFTITSRPLLIYVNQYQNKKYGTNDPILTYSIEQFSQNSGIVSGDSLNGNLSRDVGENVGNYNILLGSISNSNYTISLNSNIHFKIDKVLLEIKAKNKTKTYDGLAFTGGNGVAISGFVNSETSSVLAGQLSYSGTSQNVINAGTYTIMPSGYINDNYDISYIDGTLIVNPTTLTITAHNDSKTYGDIKTYNNRSTAFTPLGLMNNETIGSVTITDTNNGGFATAHVGETYYLTPSLAIDGTFTESNYTVIYVYGTLTINPVTLTINISKTYNKLNSFNNSNTYTLTGTLYNNNSMPTIISGSISVSSADVGLYTNCINNTIILSNSNYIVTNVSANIIPYGLTATGLDKVYDTNRDATVSLTMPLSGDTVNVTSATFSNKDVETRKQITVILNNPNYIINNIPTANITPALITITPNDQTIYYLQNDPIFTYNCIGLIQPDTISIINGSLTTSDSNRNIGSYLINSGLNALNYDIIYQPAYLNIINTPNLTTNNLFSVIQTQLSNLSNNQQITIFEDRTIPITIRSNTYINSTEIITLDLPNEITQISNNNITIIMTNSNYILATTDTTIKSINNEFVLFSLYYKALDANFNTVVSPRNPFVINVTLNNIDTFNIYKYASGVYVLLNKNSDYSISNIGNNYTISLYSNSYICFAVNETSNNNIPTLITLITLPLVSDQIYGASLSNSLLIGGSANVPGSFSFTNLAQNLIVGSNTVIVTFTPNDTTNYNSVSQPIALIVTKYTPTLIIPSIGPLLYGAILSNSLLVGAIVSNNIYNGNIIGGIFSFLNLSQKLNIGSNTVIVTFTPNDTTNYNTTSMSIILTVKGLELNEIDILQKSNNITFITQTKSNSISYVNLDVRERTFINRFSLVNKYTPGMNIFLAIHNKNYRIKRILHYNN